ncbi:MAG: hypothetical protein WCX81_04765 [Monoglobales bacterium]
MENWERDIIRELAKEKLEISNLPIMKERTELWTKHNDLKGEVPMIHFEVITVVDKGFNYECKCTSPDAVAIERQLGNSLTNYKMVCDDRVVTDDFVCLYESSFVPFNIPIKKVATDGIGFHIESQIHDLQDVSILKPSTMTFDYEKSLKWKEFVQEQIGDILNVRMGMDSFCVCLTSDIVHLMGMDNMFMAMYDNPDEFHFMMESLSDGYVTYIKELEKRGMICGNNKNDRVAQGSFGFTTDLPDNAVTLKDCWGFMDSQETVGISADMFNEFFFPYYKKVADNFGLLSYGCCEPVNPFWEKSLSRFENLRKISISPWCDEEYMGDKLKSKKVIYQRKPSPNYIGVDKNLDEDAFREHIRKTLSAAKDCKLEISFRDVYNLSGNLDKPRRAVEIVREEINNQ